MRRFGEINLRPSVALAADSSAAVVDDSLLNVDLIVCGGFVLRACFVMQRERERERERELEKGGSFYYFFVSLITCDCYRCLPLPHGVVRWSVISAFPGHIYCFWSVLCCKLSAGCIPCSNVSNMNQNFITSGPDGFLCQSICYKSSCHNENYRKYPRCL